MIASQFSEGLTCPHCGNLGLTVLQKVFLGPARKRNCLTCKHKIGLPWSAWAVTIAVIIPIILLVIALESGVWGSAILIAGIIFLTIYQRKYARLVSKE